MKKWRDLSALLYMPLAIMAVAAVVLGLAGRRSHTDYGAMPNCIEMFQPAEIPESFAVSVSERLKTELPESNIVLKVRATGEQKYMFQIFQQGAQVTQIFKGPEDLQDQIIWLTDSSWRLYPDGMQADTGFVNLMREGKEYLVFLDGEMDTTAARQDRPVYRALEHSLIAPVFCYENFENVAVEPPDEECTYVPYESVKDNEFFAVTEKGIEAMEDLKHSMLALYGG